MVGCCINIYMTEDNFPPPYKDSQIETAIEYLDGEYVLMECHYDDMRIVYSSDSALKVMDYFSENYDDDNIIHVSEILAMIIDMESREEYSEIHKAIDSMVDTLREETIDSIIESIIKSLDKKHKND